MSIEYITILANCHRCSDHRWITVPGDDNYLIDIPCPACNPEGDDA